MDDENNKGLLNKLIKICRDPLLLLVLITLVLVYYLLSEQMRIGVPYWDVFNYLNNALIFAGMGGENINTIIYLSPLIPFITSLVFRAGYVSINAIFIITSIIFLFGIIGLYLLFNERFNKIQSFTGSIIFISFPMIISWASTGGIDISGVVFSIWALYFTIRGVKKDNQFLYLVLPTIILAFLARYTAGLIIIPIVFYILINASELKNIANIKKIILGISAELLILISVISYLFIKLNTATSIFGLFTSIASSSFTGVGDVAYNTNSLYYIQYILNYISINPFQGSYQDILSPSQTTPSLLSYAVVLITIIGLSLYVNCIIKTDQKPPKSPIQINKILIGLLVLLLAGLVICFYYNSFILGEIVFFALVCFLYKYVTHNRGYEQKNIALDLLFLSWFGTYLIFQSTLPLKVDRYFITMAPAVSYFILLGISKFIDKIAPKINNKNFKSLGIYLVIIIVFLTSATVTYIDHTPKKAFTVDIGNSCQWIKDNDPQYNEKVICSDYPNAVNWFLNKEIVDGSTKWFKNTTQLSNYLKDNHVEYYIESTTKSHPDLKGYRMIKTFGVVAIYQRE